MVDSIASSSPAPLILIVDDDNSLRTLLRLAMQGEGYRIDDATNGQEALAKFERLQPDIVLLDAMMPEMDGFTCCQKLQGFSRGTTTPILMITFLDDQESVDQAFAAGATDYITKPIHWGVLSQRVRRLLQSQRALDTAKEAQEQLRKQQIWETLFQDTLQQFSQARALFPLLQSTLNYLQTILQSSRIVLSYPDQSLFLEVVVPMMASARNLAFADLAFLSSYENYYLTGQILRLDHLATSPLATSEMAILNALNCQALMNAPLLKNGQVVGLLAVHSQSPRSWDSLDAQRLAMLANLITIALR
jgi:DNA-binding response OmpR family regulator